MRETLADNLNLTGTARHNLSIRHKIRQSRLTDENSMRQRSRIPAAWESVVSYYNHTELTHINQLAQTAGCRPPFDFVETLVEDTGEVFFSEYLRWLKSERPKQDANDLCLCIKCNEEGAMGVPKEQPNMTATLPPTNHTNNMSNVPAVQQTIALQNQQYTPQQLIVPILWFPQMPAMCSIPAFCCEIYKQCCLNTNKRGRPPHDKRCSHRLKAPK